MPAVTPPIGAPCWFELASTDPEASLSFHRDLFGWNNLDNDMGEMGSYSFLRNATGTIGALCGMPPGSEGRPSSWSVYFAVADVDASVAQARELGGTLLFDPFEVPGHGRGAVLTDPNGAVFCIWQSLSGDPGDFTMFEDHAVGWVELATRDPVGARDFYAALFGWSYPAHSEHLPGLVYTEYAVGDTRYGGILPMTAEWGETPSHWALYVPVADVDACLASATELGGKICVPAFTAEGVGRIARFEDPTGAGLYLIHLQR